MSPICASDLRLERRGPRSKVIYLVPLSQRHPVGKGGRSDATPSAELFESLARNNETANATKARREATPLATLAQARG